MRSIGSIFIGICVVVFLEHYKHFSEEAEREAYDLVDSFKYDITEDEMREVAIELSEGY